MSRVIALLLSSALMLAMASPVLAVDTTKTYNSGILILLFIGFCALLIVAQLVPALLALFGMTKDAAKSARSKRATVSARKS